MTHRRQHLWISLIVGVIVWGVYFSHVVQTVGRGGTGGLALWFLGALAVVVIAEAVATGLIAWLFRRRARALDEGPTLQAALKASHIALMLLITMVLLAASALAVGSRLGGTLFMTSPQGLAVAANCLLAMVVVAELTRAAFTLALMPRR